MGIREIKRSLLGLYPRLAIAPLAETLAGVALGVIGD